MDPLQLSVPQAREEINAYEHLERSAEERTELSTHGHETHTYSKLGALGSEKTTIAEAGHQIHGWHGLAMPKSTPDMVRQHHRDQSAHSVRGSAMDVSMHSNKGVSKAKTLLMKADRTWHGTTFQKSGSFSPRHRDSHMSPLSIGLAPLWVTQAREEQQLTEKRREAEARTITDYVLHHIQQGARTTVNVSKTRSLSRGALALLRSIMPEDPISEAENEVRSAGATIWRGLQELTGTMAGLNGWLCPHVDEEGDNGQREPKKESKLTETVRHVTCGINACLRGASQVLLFNSPVTGLLVLAALYVQSVSIATYGVIGLVSATALAWVLGMDSGLLDSGLFGYNGILVGLALATFQHPDDNNGGWDGVLVAPVIVYSALSTVLFGAIGRLLVPYKVPPYTLPFNLAALMYLAATPAMDNVSTGLASTLAEHSARATSVHEYDWQRVLEAVPKGVGQVYLADNTWSGVLMIIGMLPCSPIATTAAVIGSLVGALVGVAVGAEPEAVYAGLWGYNAVLGAIAMGGMFYVLEWRSSLFALYCAAMCALAGPFVATLLSPSGVPALTFPFCLVTLTFHLLQGSIKKIIPVSIATASVPEEHRARLLLTRAAAASFRTLVAVDSQEGTRGGGEGVVEGGGGRGLSEEATLLSREATLLLSQGRRRVELQAEAVRSLWDFLDPQLETQGPGPANATSASERDPSESRSDPSKGSRGAITFESFCLCLCHHGYGHVYERGVRELWGLAHPPTPSTTLPTNPLRRTQDEGAPRALDKRGFESFLALGVEIRRKRAELDAYLEALDPVHTGYVSLTAVSEALAAFGEAPLSQYEAAHVLQTYAEFHTLTPDGEMEWWRLADLLQYALMNALGQAANAYGPGPSESAV